MALSIHSEDAVGHHIQHVTQDSGIFSKIQFHEINGERSEDKKEAKENWTVRREVNSQIVKNEEFISRTPYASRVFVYLLLFLIVPPITI
jgi:hypothetical protein